MTTPKILAFAGSTREGSFNKKLVNVAVNKAKDAGAEVTYIDLRDFPLPLYDGDLEAAEGIPANGRKLKELMLAHQGLMIASPEYNSEISGVLKNTIDWISRPEVGEKPLACFVNKVAVIMSASPGGLGGLRGLGNLRSLLMNIKVLVLPNQIAVSKAHEAFNDDGTLKDAQQQASVEALATELVTVVSKLSN